MLASVLGAIGRTERIACGAAFVVMAGALIADVFSRQVFATGLVGAPQVGVVGMIAVAMFGMGVATDHGQHLRPRLFDGLFPAPVQPTIERIANVLTAMFFAGFGVLAALVVAESMALGDRMAVLNWPIWPMQLIILAAFATNAVRFAIYAIDPGLTPQQDLPETGLDHDAPRQGSADQKGAS